MTGIVLLGGGGHALVVMDALARAHLMPTGVIAPERPVPAALAAIPWLGGDELLATLSVQETRLVNAVGSVADTTRRRAVYLAATARGFRFADVLHPDAVLSATDTLAGPGLQLLAGAVVGPGCRVGANVLINTRAVVEHECSVGDHCHIATGAVLCGRCTLEAGVHVGAGAVVRQGIRIGEGACIAAGAVVIRDVAPQTVVAGVPASVMRRQKQ